MMRQQALKFVLLVVGLAFLAVAYPVVAFFQREPALAMMGSLYITLGVFLLLAVRDPAAHCSLIGFTAWSSFAHALVMAVQGYLHAIQRGELIGAAILVMIGVVLLALAPAKPTAKSSVAAA